MKSITSTILIGAALVLVAFILEGANGLKLFEPKSRDELLSELKDDDDKQLEPKQVERLLSQVEPSTRLGRVSVKDLIRVEEISIEHCYKKELDERRDTCKLSVAGENVRRFCEYRYNELVAFCLARVEPIMRQNLIWIGAEPRRELETYRNGLRRLSGGQEISVETVRKFNKEDNTTSERFKAAAEKHCLNVIEHFDSVDAILKHGQREIEDITMNRSLLDAFDLYKMCQVVLRSQEN